MAIIRLHVVSSILEKKMKRENCRQFKVTLIKNFILLQHSLLNTSVQLEKSNEDCTLQGHPCASEFRHLQEKIATKNTFCNSQASLVSNPNYISRKRILHAQIFQNCLNFSWIFSWKEATKTYARWKKMSF